MVLAGEVVFNDGLAVFNFFEHKVSVVNLEDGKGYAMTIFKNANNKAPINLLKEEVMSEDVYELVQLLITGQVNLLYTGEAGSGKTTTVNALLNDILTQEEDIHLVEAYKEMPFPESKIHWHEISAAIDPKKLVRKINKAKPEYIVINEFYGPEIITFVDNMKDDNSTIGVIYGESSDKVMKRLVTNYIYSHPELKLTEATAATTISKLIDFIFLQKQTKDGNRILSSIHEVRYNNETKGLDLTPIVEYKTEEKEYKFSNKISEEIVEKMIRNGVSLKELKKYI